MAIKTKTSVRMKVAAIAVAMIASQSVWAGDYYFYYGDNASTYTLSELTSGWWSNNQHSTAAEGAPGVNSDVRLAGGTYLIGDGDELSYSYYEVGHGWGRYTTNNITGGSLTLTGNLAVGYWSDGHALLKMTGGAVSAGTILVPATDGNTACKDAHVVQEGGSITSRNDTKIGTLANDAADWTISGGSLSVGGELLIADAAGSVDTLTVSGDAEITVAGAMTVGSWGTGTLTMSGGNMTVGGNTYIGRCSNNNGAAVGTFTLTGGTFIGNAVQIGAMASTTGTLNINGGTFAVSGFTFPADATDTINLNGGILAATAANSAFLPASDYLTLNVTADSVISNDYAITIAKDIATGSYTLTKKGKGILTFTGAVSGKINIAEGVCVIPTASLESGDLTVECSGTGRLYIDASSVASGDTVLTFGNAVTLPDGADTDDYIIVKTAGRTLKAEFSGKVVAIATDDAAASGVTTVWVGGTDTSWSTAANWTRGAPTSVDTAVFVADATTAYSSAMTINKLKFASNCTLTYSHGAESQSLTLSSIEGTGTIVLVGAGIGGTSSAPLTIPAAVKIVCNANNKSSTLWYSTVYADIFVNNTWLMLANNAAGEVHGAISGTGTVRPYGWKLFGDNSNFEGTFNIAAKNDHLFCSPDAGSEKATLALSDKQVGISATYASAFSGKTLKLGKITGTGGVYMNSISGVTLEVGGKGEAMSDTFSFLRGTFTLKKTGTNVWTYASNINNGTLSGFTVEEGTLRVPSSNSYLNGKAITVEDGATIGGAGTVGTLTFKNGAAFEVFTTTADETTTVDNLTATTVTLEGDLVVKMSEETAAAAGSSAADVLTATALDGTVDKQAVVDGAGNPVAVYGESGLYWYAKKAGTAIQIFKRNPKAGFIVIIQ